ncbi:MAG TPA: hypothetical protein VGJ61_11855 [Solirubrobacterales bacterium]
MHWSRKYVIVGGSILALAAGGTGAAVAIGNGHEDENGAHGPGADQATAAALMLIPGGHANSVERDSENGATWEVEVRKPDGGTVDVRLDQNYQLVVVEADSEDQGGQ